VSLAAVGSDLSLDWFLLSKRLTGTAPDIYLAKLPRAGIVFFRSVLACIPKGAIITAGGPLPDDERCRVAGPGETWCPTLRASPRSARMAIKYGLEIA
jgi:hypothetical protein